MKIKKYYYCLTDNNNKPDFRYLFTSKKDAEKKIIELKNSTKGETLFVSDNKRDFFIDGIKKNFIGKSKLIKIKKGCWVKMSPKQVNILDTIQPEAYFRETVRQAKTLSIKEVVSAPEATSTHSKENITQKQTSQQTSLSPKTPSIETLPKEQKISPRKTKTTNYSKQEESSNKDNKKKNASLQKRITSPLIQKKRINLLTYHSIFQRKLLIANFAIILLICLISILYISNKTKKEIALSIANKQQEIVNNQTNPENEKLAVLGAMDSKENEESTETIPTTDSLDDIDQVVFNTLMEFEKIRADKLEEKIMKMVAGTPMEQMAPYIAKQDKIVAAFLVGIAKKESNYGRRVPVLNGKDCYNYWGYRGIRKKMGSGGHTCFDSPEDAVKTVGGRIERLVKSGIDTPQEMVLWKCGSDCNATGGQAAANKWIRDVNMYFSKMIELTEEEENTIPG